jgi:hypothetical protein
MSEAKGILYSFLWVSSSVLTTVLIGTPKLCLASVDIQCDDIYHDIVPTAIQEALILIEGAKAFDPDQDYTDERLSHIIHALVCYSVPN